MSDKSYCAKIKFTRATTSLIFTIPSPFISPLDLLNVTIIFEPSCTFVVSWLFLTESVTSSPSISTCSNWQFSLGWKRLFSDVSNRLTDTFSSYFNSNFKEFSTTENQFDLPLIINLKLVPTKLKTLHSTSNVKCSVADLIVNAHNSLSAFSAKQKRNNNRIFVLRKNLFLCLSVAKSERHYCPFFI